MFDEYKLSEEQHNRILERLKLNVFQEKSRFQIRRFLFWAVSPVPEKAF